MYLKTIAFMFLEEFRYLFGELPALLSVSYKTIDIKLDQPLSNIEKQLANVDLVITSGEYVPVQIVPLALIQALKIPTLHIMDGIVEWRNWLNRPFAKGDLSPYPPPHPFLIPSMCDYVACIGLNQKLLLDTFGNIDKTVVVGSPRLDSFSLKYKPYKNTSQLDDKILISTAKTPAFSTEQLDQLIYFFKNLKTYLEARKIEATWRISNSLSKAINVNPSTTSLDADLAECKATFTTPSTVWLESMITNKPTGILNPFSDPLLVTSPWIINSEYEFDLISDALNPPKAKMRLQEYYLQLNLMTDCNANTRLLELVTSILSVDDSRTIRDSTSEKKSLKTIRDIFPVFFSGFHSKDMVQGAFNQYHLIKNSEYSMILKNYIEKIKELEK